MHITDVKSSACEKGFSRTFTPPHVVFLHDGPSMFGLRCVLSLYSLRIINAWKRSDLVDSLGKFDFILFLKNMLKARKNIFSLK